MERKTDDAPQKYVYKIVQSLYGLIWEWPRYDFRSWAPYGTPGLSSGLDYQIGKITECHPGSMGIYCFDSETAAMVYCRSCVRRVILKCRYCGEINHNPKYMTSAGIQHQRAPGCITVDAVIPVAIVWRHHGLTGIFVSDNEI